MRVIEDAASPSSPPSPDSSAENKKSRAIIVSVKRSGRVRLHKARENPQGTFSIGKTWVLDDLSAIESYTGSTPTTYEEQLRKEWAGDAGVLLTIQKPYFWQISTQQEKNFFVGSLIKIYRKYTSGKEPRMSGFSNKELSDFGVTGQPAPLIAAQRHPAPAEPSPYTSPSPVSSPFVERIRARGLRPPSSDSNAPTTATSNYMRSPSMTSRGEEGPSRFQKLRSGSDASSTRNELRPLTPRDGSVVSKVTFNSSKESLLQDTPGSSIGIDKPKINGGLSAISRNRDASDYTKPPDSPRRISSAEQSYVLRMKPQEQRPGTATRKASGSSDTREAPPERRRPPLASTSASTNTSSGNLRSESNIKSVAANANTGEHGSGTKPWLPATNGSFGSGNKPWELNTSTHPQTESSSTLPPSSRDISEALAIESPVDSIASPLPLPEEHRPGLGPMILKKKSAKEIANTFRRVATAATAFKPRAGGAAERLMRSDGVKSPDTTSGDGIHGVFVARSKDSTKSTELTPAASTSSLVTPNNTKTEAAKEISTPVSKMTAEKRMSDNLIPQPLSIPKQMETFTPPDEIKSLPEQRKPLPDRSAYYAKIIGCDAAMLEGRTSEIDAVLDDYGWNVSADGSRKTVQELQADIKRDLAKLETGSWLSVMETGDQRVAQVSKLIDDAIHECDELDGLLTLYNVELGVSNPSSLSETIA